MTTCVLCGSARMSYTYVLRIMHEYGLFFLELQLEGEWKKKEPWKQMRT